jgi:hypothetical protein
MASPTTPSATAGSAPPNFYSQAGQMAAQGPAAGGVAGAGGAAAAGQPGGGKDQDHQFLDMTTKLLSVIQKMQDMKPRGQDVSKELQAAADAVKQAVSKVFGKDGMAGDGSDQTGDSTDAGAGVSADGGAAGGGGGGAPDTGATA